MAHETHLATIWISLDLVRVSERGRRSVSSATVEQYRRWLEQGRDAPPVRLARQRARRTSCATVGTASQRLWLPVTQ